MLPGILRLMNKGGYQKANSGFTIVETMIVLAVTGVLFLSAMVFINGRQNKTAFMTAINGLQQQLQQIINETQSGYYPNNGTYTCIGTSSPVTFDTSANNKQGANGGCIFLGKAVQFGLDTDQTQLGILPLVGNQLSAGNPAVNLTQARPRAVYPATGESGPALAPTSSADTEQMQQGLTVAANNATGCGASFGYGMCYIVGASKVKTGTVAFVSGDASGNIASLSNGDLSSGSQQMSLYAVKGALVNESLGDSAKAIGNNGVVGTTKLVHPDSVSICIASAGTNQSGLFTIDDGLHVTLDIKTGLVC